MQNLVITVSKMQRFLECLRERVTHNDLYELSDSDIRVGQIKCHLSNRPSTETDLYKFARDFKTIRAFPNAAFS